MGQVLLQCTMAHGAPPGGVAWDGGLPNKLIHNAFLGLIDPRELTSVPFFQDCSWEGLTVPFFGYRVLMHLRLGEYWWVFRFVQLNTWATSCSFFSCSWFCWFDNCKANLKWATHAHISFAMFCQKQCVALLVSLHIICLNMFEYFSIALSKPAQGTQAKIWEEHSFQCLATTTVAMSTNGCQSNCFLRRRSPKLVMYLFQTLCLGWVLMHFNLF